MGSYFPPPGSGGGGVDLTDFVADQFGIGGEYDGDAVALSALPPVGPFRMIPLDTAYLDPTNSSSSEAVPSGATGVESDLVKVINQSSGGSILVKQSGLYLIKLAVSVSGGLSVAGKASTSDGSVRLPIMPGETDLFGMAVTVLLVDYAVTAGLVFDSADDAVEFTYGSLTVVPLILPSS